MIRTRRPTLAALLVLLSTACSPCPCGDAPAADVDVSVARRDDVGADLVVFGRVRTMDDGAPEADAVVVTSGRIERVVRAESARSRIGPRTRVLRAPPGAIVMPGIVESHAHLRSIGRAMREVDVSGTASAAEAAERARAAAGAGGSTAWIVGRGWNHERWEGRAWPAKEALDAAVPDRPVMLVRADGHAVWCNSAALAAAGVRADTPDPPGGEILRAADGSPLGVLVDNAADLVEGAARRGFDPAEARADFLRAQGEALRNGITEFVDCGDTAEALVELLRLYAEGTMRMRVYAMAGCATRADLDVALARPPRIGLHDDRVSIRAIKMYADGALGSRGAALIAPYSDRPGAYGLAVTPPDLLAEAARRCAAAGYQLCVHAIGDRAVRTTLDAYAAAFQDLPPARRRFRIEHAQLVDPLDAPRFRELGVIPSVQPCHATSDAPWVPARLGMERAERIAYPWRTLIEAGARPPSGTDAPVEPLSPFENFRSAITRMDGSGRLAAPFIPAQRMNRLEALYSMTRWGAYACFAEARRGRLTAGRDADLVIVSEDLMTCPAERASEARALATIVGGEVLLVDASIASN